MKTVIDRENFEVRVVAPSGAEVCIARVRQIPEGYYVNLLGQFLQPLKTEEEAWEALLAHLGLTEHEQPAEPKESEEVQRLKNLIKDSNKIIHDAVVVKQAAWIEWKHGRGAEAAMRWIQNALVGPGFIPDEDEPYGKEAQAYYDANCSDPFPACYCGRPSNVLSGSEGFCCEDHYEARCSQAETQENSNV